VSKNHKESDFSKDFGKTIPVEKSFWLRPINHRKGGLPTGIHLINTADFNEQEFSVDGHWHRMSDYHFGVVEPEKGKASKAIEKMLAVKDASDGKVALWSCQGQAMDGYSELANYRQILEQYRKE